MRLRRFLALDLVGAVVWVVPIVALGYAIGQPAVAVAEDITRYGLVLGIVLGAVWVVGVAVRRLTEARGARRTA
jgi:membrane protein DedA with SNARE-associated domain